MSFTGIHTTALAVSIVGLAVLSGCDSAPDTASSPVESLQALSADWKEVSFIPQQTPAGEYQYLNGKRTVDGKEYGFMGIRKSTNDNCIVSVNLDNTSIVQFGIAKNGQCVPMANTLDESLIKSLTPGATEIASAILKL
jgi:hypothetical protein